MEASSARGGSLLASSSQPPRKEWRAVSDGSYRTSGSEETERGSLRQSDERTIYEEGADVVEFCSIEGSNGLSDELLQQRLQEVARQREKLQRLEFELKSVLIARPQVAEVRDSFDAQLKEHAATNAKLKEQLQERDKYILDMELKLQDKDRELRALQIDNEAAWAKDDLLREQNKELATFRRERDNSEAERAQHLKQIHDLQECLREKERQLLSLEEQHRVAQENLIFKEEQLREAHTWISRVQEIDALQSTTNQTLQAELHDRTEQFNQFWLGFQRHYAEMERHHLQTIQQLQIELALYKDGSKERASDPSSQMQPKANDPHNMTVNGSSAISNGNVVDGSKKTEQGSSLSSPLVGISPSFIQPPQITYMMHPSQGIPSQSLSPTNSSLQLGSFQVVPAIPSQFWPTPEAVPEGATQMTTTQPKFEQSHADQNLARPNTTQSQVDLSNQQISGLITTVQPPEKSQVIKSNKTQPSPQKDVADFANLNSNYNSAISGLQFGSTDLTTALQSHESSQMREVNGSVEGGTNGMSYTQVASSVVTMAKEEEKLPLLDERSLLACIVRAIPPGPNNHIKISTNLPNRLSKMLAPLHWHDYMKHYGKLDDFVARHPELFVIEGGDLIRLREGAHQIVSATTAAAKVAAAAAAPYSAFLPTVAVTPVAQSSRQKRSPDQFMNGAATTLVHKKSEQQALGFNVIQGVADVRISNNGAAAASNARQAAFGGGKHTPKTIYSSISSRKIDE